MGLWSGSTLHSMLLPSLIPTPALVLSGTMVVPLPRGELHCAICHCLAFKIMMINRFLRENQTMNTEVGHLARWPVQPPYFQTKMAATWVRQLRSCKYLFSAGGKSDLAYSLDMGPIPCSFRSGGSRIDMESVGEVTILILCSGLDVSEIFSAVNGTIASPDHCGIRDSLLRRHKHGVLGLA